MWLCGGSKGHVLVVFLEKTKNLREKMEMFGQTLMACASSIFGKDKKS
jgi:hypothetical protein